MATEPWQKAEIPGPRRASVITKPDVVVAMVKRAKRPLLVVGHRAVEIELNGRKLIDYIIDIAKKANIPIVATAHLVGEFLKRGYRPAAFMSAINIGNRLADRKWMGIDDKGPHDLAIFIGLPYYMEWTILSGLKHFAPELKTVTLDNVYHPNADWSFSNIPMRDWAENLKSMAEKL